MIKLTKKQIKILEETFNYALNALEDSKDRGYYIKMNEDGTCETFDIDKKIQEIIDLFDFFRKNIEKVVEE